MKNFRNTFLGFCLGAGSLIQSATSVVQPKGPAVLTTVDGKQVCPVGYVYTWPTMAKINADINAQPFCKRGGNKFGSNASYLAAQLNGSDQSQLTKKLVAQASSVDNISPEIKSVTTSSDIKKTKKMFEDASEAKSALNEFRIGLEVELDNLTNRKVDKAALSQIQAKITQWNSDVKGSGFAPINLCACQSK